MEREINISSMDRDLAVLIYKEKIYEDITHQHALNIALKEHGEEYYEDSYLDNFINEIAEKTNKQAKDNELFTFSVYDNEYLIAHYKSNLDINLEVVKKYANENNLKVGYFQNMMDDNCIVYI